PGSTWISNLSLHDALPIFGSGGRAHCRDQGGCVVGWYRLRHGASRAPAPVAMAREGTSNTLLPGTGRQSVDASRRQGGGGETRGDRKSTRLNSSHVSISYA